MQTILFLMKNHGKLWYLMLFIIKYHGLILISGLEVLILRGGKSYLHHSIQEIIPGLKSKLDLDIVCSV